GGRAGTCRGVAWSASAALLEPCEVGPRLGRLFGGWVGIDEPLEACLGERGLPDLDESEGLLVGSGGDTGASRMVDVNLPERLDRLLELLERPVLLALSLEQPPLAEVRPPDHVHKLGAQF